MMLWAVSRKKLEATASYASLNSALSNTATKSPVTMSMLPPAPRMSCRGGTSGTRTSRSCSSSVRWLHDDVTLQTCCALCMLCVL